MTTRQTISHADETYAGNAFYGPASPDGRRGARWSHLTVLALGPVAAAVATGVIAAITATGAVTLSASGSLVSSGVATFDVPRCLSLTATGDLSASSFTFTGTDDYSQTMSEKILGPTGTGVARVGKKAFKTITRCTATGSAACALTAGTSTVLGLDIRAATAGDILGVYVNGVPETTLTVTAGLTATDVSTATTGDVRGTVAPNTAPDGAKYFTVLVHIPDRSKKEAVYGVDQA